MNRDDVFRYGDHELVDGRLRCTYEVGGRTFTETVEIADAGPVTPVAEAAATLVHLLAGVSYYKAFAPPVVDLGAMRVRPSTATFLREVFVEGLGEFAYRNDIDLGGLEVVGGVVDPTPLPAPTSARAGDRPRPLVPFGGGMDSLVSVDLVRTTGADPALFVVEGRRRYAAIEQAAAATGLPVQRAVRTLDPQILRSAELGFLNGHVPVTGIIGAIAVLAAALTDRDAVVMSNEWSASMGNVAHHGRIVNHQYSKGSAFETAFRTELAAWVGAAVDWFSLLRPFSELWIARRFAERPEHLRTFHSCNRAFHVDPSARLDRWCGRCDKCAFIDLVLAPYVPAADLAAVFDGREPLDDPSLLDVFATLLDIGEGPKPFECVGDVAECRTAVALAAERPDRAASPVLTVLCDRLGADAVARARADADRLLGPLGPHTVPEPYASAAGLG